MSNRAVNIEISKQSQQNLFKQMDKLKKLAPEKARGGMIKLLFDIKALAQNKLKFDKHIVTSRLRNSIYVQANKLPQVQDNDLTYSDNDGKSYKSALNVKLNDNEGAVGTNVEYAGKIEFGYDSFLYWGLKNADLEKRWREVSAELLNGLK